MEFFNLKTKRTIDVPDKELKRRKFERSTSKGTKQTRYAVTAEVGGTKLFKFVNEQTYKSLKVPEVKG
jgi:hypothetical protein